MSADMDEREYVHGFHDGSEDRLEHHPHHNGERTYWARLGYEDGWTVAARVTGTTGEAGG
jgi:hypothetical protein